MARMVPMVALAMGGGLGARKVTTDTNVTWNRQGHSPLKEECLPRPEPDRGAEWRLVI